MKFALVLGLVVIVLDLATRVGLVIRFADLNFRIDFRALQPHPESPWRLFGTETAPALPAQ